MPHVECVQWHIQSGGGFSDQNIQKCDFAVQPIKRVVGEHTIIFAPTWPHEAVGSQQTKDSVHSRRLRQPCNTSKAEKRQAGSLAGRR